MAMKAILDRFCTTYSFDNQKTILKLHMIKNKDYEIHSLVYLRPLESDIRQYQHIRELFSNLKVLSTTDKNNQKIKQLISDGRLIVKAISKGADPEIMLNIIRMGAADNCHQQILIELITPAIEELNKAENDSYVSNHLTELERRIRDKIKELDELSHIKKITEIAPTTKKAHYIDWQRLRLFSSLWSRPRWLRPMFRLDLDVLIRLYTVGIDTLKIYILGNPQITQHKPFLNSTTNASSQSEGAKEQTKAATTIQAIGRGHLVRKAINAEAKAATTIQVKVLRYLARKVIKEAATTIQAIGRGNLTRKKTKTEINAIRAETKARNAEVRATRAQAAAEARVKAIKAEAAKAVAAAQARAKKAEAAADAIINAAALKGKTFLSSADPVSFPSDLSQLLRTIFGNTIIRMVLIGSGLFLHHLKTICLNSKGHPPRFINYEAQELLKKIQEELALRDLDWRLVLRYHSEDSHKIRAVIKENQGLLEKHGLQFKNSTGLNPGLSFSRNDNGVRTDLTMATLEPLAQLDLISAIASLPREEQLRRLENSLEIQNGKLTLTGTVASQSDT